MVCHLFKAYLSPKGVMNTSNHLLCSFNVYHFFHAGKNEPFSCNGSKKRLLIVFVHRNDKIWIFSFAVFINKLPIALLELLCFFIFVASNIFHNKSYDSRLNGPLLKVDLEPLFRHVQQENNLIFSVKPWKKTLTFLLLNSLFITCACPRRLLYIY